MFETEDSFFFFFVIQKTKDFEYGSDAWADRALTLGFCNMSGVFLLQITMKTIISQV